MDKQMRHTIIVAIQPLQPEETNKLDKVEIDAMWIISEVAACSNISNLYEKLRWQSLGQQRIKPTLSMCYKITHCDAPSYPCDILPQTVGN